MLTVSLTVATSGFLSQLYSTLNRGNSVFKSETHYRRCSLVFTTIFAHCALDCGFFCFLLKRDKCSDRAIKKPSLERNVTTTHNSSLYSSVSGIDLGFSHSFFGHIEDIYDAEARAEPTISS